jgi:hypothetical protein
MDSNKRWLRATTLVGHLKGEALTRSTPSGSSRYKAPIGAQIAVVVLLCLSIFADIACGSNEHDGTNQHGCAVKIGPEQTRIKPQNSGYKCLEIRGILAVLPRDPGVWPLTSESGPKEVCRVYPRSMRPLLVRCWHEGKRFSVLVVE